MKDEHNLDKLFREGLDQVDIPFHEPDWAEMSKKLDQQDKKTKFPLWWSLLGAAAASLTLFFLFYHAPKNNPSAVRIEKKNPVILSPENNPRNLLIDTARDQPDVAVRYPDKQLSVPANHHLLSSIPDVANRQLQPVRSQVNIGIDSGDEVSLAAVKMKNTWPAESTTGKSIPSANELLNKVNPNRLSLTLLAAPDVSSTSSSVSNKVSSNFGLMINYALTKKIGVSTGIIYTKKIYDYNGFGASLPGYSAGPWLVNADCKVLDIPVNMNYRVFKKRNITVNVSAGLSSYIMLNEKYQLTSGPDLTVTNEEVTGNKHLMGIANFSVGVERKVNSRISLGLQPFYKVPLTGIGKYQGNLSSAGLSLLINIKGLSNN